MISVSVIGFICFTTVCIKQNIFSSVAILCFTCACAHADCGSRTRLPGVRYKEVLVKCSAFTKHARKQKIYFLVTV
jgi:hypothetical protein